MNILALDTSMGACSAAVFCAGGTSEHLFARAELMARGHAEALMPMVAEAMAEAGVMPSGLDLIAATPIWLLSSLLLLPIPNGLDLKHAALTEPMAVGLHAVNKSNIAPGETALVLGCGPIEIGRAHV